LDRSRALHRHRLAEHAFLRSQLHAVHPLHCAPRATATTAWSSPPNGIKTWVSPSSRHSTRAGKFTFAGPEQLHECLDVGFAERSAECPSGPECGLRRPRAPCTFDRVVLAWILRRRRSSIQVSGDAANWQTLQPLQPTPRAPRMTSTSPQPAHGRYVRILMTKPAQAGDPYILSELEALRTRRSHAGSASRSAANRRMAPSSSPAAPGSSSAPHSTPTTANASPNRATRLRLDDRHGSGPVLTSYLNDGAIVDPTSAQPVRRLRFFLLRGLLVSRRIRRPALAPGHHCGFNFDGINWKAEIYLNGQHLGPHRRRDDARTLRRRQPHSSRRPERPRRSSDRQMPIRAARRIKPDAPSTAARSAAIIPPFTPPLAGTGSPPSVAAMTASGTTVSLTTTGAVSIQSPLVSTTLPLPTPRTPTSSSSHAAQPRRAAHRRVRCASPSATFRSKSPFRWLDQKPKRPAHARHGRPPSTSPIRNSGGRSATATRIYPVTIALRLRRSSLRLEILPGGSPPVHVLRRQRRSQNMDQRTPLHRPRRHWGFSESMLRYRAREYETAMRYHRDLHFDMIRN